MADFGPLLEGFELVGLSVGFRRELLAIAVDRAQYRMPKGGTRRQTTKPHTFKVLVSDHVHDPDSSWSSDPYLLAVIADELWNFHHVQSLSSGELLLACARCAYLGDGKGERNGRIYSLEGDLVSDLTLGDGIAHMQADSLGRIWAGYFDEGVFGNYGWGGGRGSQPLGASGLVGWGLKGERAFTYTSPLGASDEISDCYALNVVSDREIWAYYYRPFPIVRIEPELPRELWRTWDSPVEGAAALAVWNDSALLGGNYEDRACCSMLHLPERGKEATVKQELRFIGEDGADLSKAHALARGPYLYFLDDARVYRADTDRLVGG